jgi:hypothetical protein
VRRVKGVSSPQGTAEEEEAAGGHVLDDGASAARDSKNYWNAVSENLRCGAKRWCPSSRASERVCERTPVPAYRSCREEKEPIAALTLARSGISDTGDAGTCDTYVLFILGQMTRRISVQTRNGAEGISQRQLPEVENPTFYHAAYDSDGKLLNPSGDPVIRDNRMLSLAVHESTSRAEQGRVWAGGFMLDAIQHGVSEGR